MDTSELRDKVIEVLQTVHDPEIPVNIWELGLVYDVKIEKDKLPIIKADAVQMSQLLQNLISNAIKFRDKRTPRITITSKHEDSKWIIAVKDNGVGMSTEKLSKLFNIDSQQVSNGTAQEKGNGLGLLLCKEFVEKNKGKITVESYPGKGTSFIVSLPLN